MKTHLTFAILAASISGAFAANITVSDALVAADSGNIHYNSPNTTNVVFRSNGGTILTTTNTPDNHYWLGYFAGWEAGNAVDQSLRAAGGAELFARVNNAQQFIPLGFGQPGLGSDIDHLQELNPNNRLANTMTGVTYLDGTANAAAVGGVNRGTRLFLLMLNQSTLSQSASTEYGLFSADTWLIPATGTANIILSLKDVDTAPTVQAPLTGEVFQGSLGSLGLTGIPEPTTGVLSLLAALGLMARRRR